VITPTEKIISDTISFAWSEAEKSEDWMTVTYQCFAAQKLSMNMGAAMSSSECALAYELSDAFGFLSLISHQHWSTK